MSVIKIGDRHFCKNAKHPRLSKTDRQTVNEIKAYFRKPRARLKYQDLDKILNIELEVVDCCDENHIYKIKDKTNE